MRDDRYITMTVAYDHYPQDGRPLSWIAPELRHAGLVMTEDHTGGPNPSRTWAGVVDGPTFKRLATAWHLHDATRARTFDGMNWEVDGRSPIVYVALEIDVVRDGYGHRRSDQDYAADADDPTKPLRLSTEAPAPAFWQPNRARALGPDGARGRCVPLQRGDR